MSHPDVLLVLSTCPDMATARRLAGVMVERRLAACVNQLPGLGSTYRWEGKVAHEKEVLLLIKTTAERYPALAQTLAELHPYELPEIVAVPVTTGLPGYLAWVAEQTTDPA